MKTIPYSRKSMRWRLGLIVLLVAGLLWLVELVGLPTAARTGFRLGIVISGFCLIWLWLLTTSPHPGDAP